MNLLMNRDKGSSFIIKGNSIPSFNAVCWLDLSLLIPYILFIKDNFLFNHLCD